LHDEEGTVNSARASTDPQQETEALCSDVAEVGQVQQDMTVTSAEDLVYMAIEITRLQRVNLAAHSNHASL
jgi:hypothetical protein